MKKTLNINLAGYPFIIDEDAYNMLKDYLDTIRYAFDTKDDTSEIASDIETRIAELLINKEADSVRIVSREEVAQVIERIGKPSEFIEVSEDFNDGSAGKEHSIKEEETIIGEEKITPPPYESNKNSGRSFSRKKIFRDPDNAMLGGVCSGLAYYLNIDVTIVRLLTVILFFLSATTVAIAYIILWIVVPEARTPYQRMMMMGENPSVENIGKTVTDNYGKNEGQENMQEKKGGLEGFLHQAFSIFVKCLIILGLLIAVPLLLALVLAFIGCIIAACIIGFAIVGGITEATYGWFDSDLEGLMVFYILLAVIGGIITIGIPLWLLVRMIWKTKDENKSMNQNLNPNTRRSLLIVWICGIALLAVFTVKAVKTGKEATELNHVHNERFEAFEDISKEEIENITVTKDGVTIETEEGKKINITKNPSGIKTEIERAETIKEEEKTDTLKVEIKPKENMSDYVVTTGTTDSIR